MVNNKLKGINVNHSPRIRRRSDVSISSHINQDVADHA